jgi:drug/metabolite transporter (DMT)-like permease
MGTPDRKGGRYIIGTLAAGVGVWFAAYTGRAVGQKPWLQITGNLIMALALITMAVQAFTDKRYPETRGVKVARLMLFVGWALSIFGARK